MMKSSKGVLRTLLFSSIASIGMPMNGSNLSGTPYTTSSNKREDADDTDVTSSVMDRLASGTLSSSVELVDVDGHSSHVSHSSHASSSSSTSSGSAKSAAYVGGGIAGVAGIYFLIKWFVNKHQNNLDKIESYQYGDRQLSSNDYGNDVDLLVNLLKKNDALTSEEIAFLPKRRGHYTYGKQIKQSVKKVKRTMGQKRSSKSDKRFLSTLRDWQRTKKTYYKALNQEEILIDYDEIVLKALAILLTEKGYLDSYKVEEIMSASQIEKIRQAYYVFLTRHNLAIKDTIDKKIFKLLYSMPSV
jgi:hypothetical protein